MTNKLLRKGSVLFALMAFFAMTHSVNAQYCIPGATNDNRYINNFSTTNGTENISNLNSGFSTNGYGDFFETQTIARDPGDSFDFSVDIEGGTAGFRVWVDWNQDNVFDASEVAYQSTAYSASHTGTIVVPADAELGETRMRIVSHWLSTSGDIPPCTTGFTYGEFEDYKVVTGILAACTEAVAGTVVGDLSREVCANTAFSVSVTGNSDPAEGLTRVWQSSPAGANTWTDLTSGAATLNVAGIDAATDYRYHVECANGDSDTSDVIAVTLNPNPSECYCTPEGVTPGRYIDNFSTTNGVENISNLESGFSPSGYGDFYDTHTLSQVTGETVDFTVSIVGGTAGFRIWVDWNQDGSFDIDEEVAYNSTSYSASHTGSFDVAESALEGETRMRIVSNWSSSTGTVDPCAVDFAGGEFEDYKFVVIFPDACTGTPEAGIAMVDPASGNGGTNYTVSASGYGAATGLSFQWQSNINGAGWIDEGVASDFHSPYTATAAPDLGDVTEWRLALTCTVSDETAYSTIATFTTTLTYCEATSGTVEAISRVLFAGIDNDSPATSALGYEDFTAIVANVEGGETYSFAAEGNTGGDYTNYFTVWIDWNQNGEFEATEMYEIGSIEDSNGTDGQQAVNDILVPVDAQSGDTRMRVRKNFNTSLINPCGSNSFGQTEDYTVNVAGGGGTFPSPYCDIADADDVIVEAITKVELDDTSITNDDTDSVLIDKTAIVVDVMAGETYTLSVEGDTEGDFDTNIVAFIDWNQNDILDDAGEIYELGTLTNSTGSDGISVSMDIDVPSDAVLGETRIRITKTYFDDLSDAIVTPCGIQFDPFGMGIFPGYGQALDFTLNVLEADEGDGVDCAQGDDSNAFENGFNITAGTDFRNTDDFMVSADNTLNIQTIELNLLAMEPVVSLDFNFYNDDNGAPGSTIVESLIGQIPYAQVPIGTNFGYTVYTVLVEVDLSFEGGATGTTYWMQPVSNGDSFWEVSSEGTLGAPIHTSEAMGAWVPDMDGSQGVFKLHCTDVAPPPAECLFGISFVEPITRVVMANVNNQSSPTSAVALEDFTDISIIAQAGATVSVALEGFTGGNYTNYFTIFINTDSESEWSSYETFEIGSVVNSTGTDGQQATANIVIPASLAEGEYLLRVIKNFASSPLNPCASYSFGQAEDYTLVIGELDDCSGTPDGGIASVNPESGNINTPYTVSAEDYSFGNGITYQWQSNTDGAGWEDEGSVLDNYAPYSATAPGENGVTVEWRLAVTCTMSSETSYSETATFTTGMTYCTPVLDCTDADMITNVSFQEIDNTTACSPNGYGDYTAMVATVQAGGTYPISVSVGDGWAYESVSVWIDFDGNGSFEQNEFFYIGTGSNQALTGDIDIPSSLVDGDYRMRVRVAAVGEDTATWDMACDEAQGYGETEDYTVTVDGLIGVNDNSISNFTYYPNPMVDVLYISASENVQSVSAYNVLGQEVLSSRHFANGQVDVSTLPTGTYTFRVTFENGLVENFKALKK